MRKVGHIVDVSEILQPHVSRRSELLEPMVQVIVDEEINVCRGHRVVSLKNYYNVESCNAGNASHTYDSLTRNKTHIKEKYFKTIVQV
jgi:hypothetical protein